MVFYCRFLELIDPALICFPLFQYPAYYGSQEKGPDA